MHIIKVDVVKLGISEVYIIHVLLDLQARLQSHPAVNHHQTTEAIGLKHIKIQRFIKHVLLSIHHNQDSRSTVQTRPLYGARQLALDVVLFLKPGQLLKLIRFKL